MISKSSRFYVHYPQNSIIYVLKIKKTKNFHNTNIIFAINEIIIIRLDWMKLNLQLFDDDI